MNWRLAGLPLLSAILLFASFPRVSQGYLAWIAFVPLLLVFLRTDGWIGPCLAGFTQAFLADFGLLIWIPEVLRHYGGVSAPVAWLLYFLMLCLLACIPALAWAALCILRKVRGDDALWAFPFVWVSMEYLRNFVPFGGFPWLQAGYTQTDVLELVQVADTLGVYGVSFLIAWVNTAIARCWRSRHSGWRRLAPLFPAAILILCTYGYGMARLRRWANPPQDATVVILQGNLSFDHPVSDQVRKFQFGYEEMVQSLGTESYDLLLIPESPSPLSFEHDAAYRAAMQRLAHRFSVGVVFNNIAEGARGTEYYNSAYFMNSAGGVAGRYDKIRLVPFGEYLPLRRLFSFMDTITKDVSEFQPGGQVRVVELGHRSLNAVICYEIIFPDLVREFAAAGSDLIVNLTNDGWYGDSAAPYQHLAMARWRAVENRKYLLRAANTGISAIVDPAGRVLGQTGLFREATMVGRFGFVSGESAYTRAGDMFAHLCVIMSILAWLPIHRGAAQPGPERRFGKQEDRDVG